MKQSKSKNYDFDDSFYKLASEVTTVLAKNKDGTTQEQQVEELLDAERKFKDTILKYRQATEIYKKFLQKICVTNKNILSARPYFRETATSFSKRITPAIKDNNIELLKTFDINYQFIKFIRESWLGPFPKRAEQLFQRVHKSREILIENNIPLAINRAKLFYRKVPKSHLSLMDLIGICAMGLAAGVDKWCGKYTPVFRSVCIGRMVGNMIDEYSETMIHFYPSDKRILYKANSIRGRQQIDDIDELVDAVNKSFAQDELEGKNIPKKDIKVSELSYLMSAASTVSADQTMPGLENGFHGEGESGYGVYSYTADPNVNIEADYIEKESISHMLTLAKNLPIIQKKVLLLKGLKLN